MGSLRKRGGVWHADYRDENGLRHRHSLATRDKKVAKQRLRRAELGQRVEGGPAQKKALVEAVAEMVAIKKAATAEAYKAKSGQLFRIFGMHRDIATVTAADVTTYITQRRGECASDHTIHKELVVLRQALKEARRRGESGADPGIVPPWKADYNPQDRWLSRWEFDALIASAPPRRKIWIAIQCLTGANKGEMQQLTWEHVDLRAGQILIPGKKRETRWRHVPINAELRAWLESADREAPLVPPWPDVSHALPDLCRKAGIDPANTNDLRRTFGSWLAQEGVPILTIARLMGNSVAVAEKAYARLSEAAFRESVEKISGTNRSQSPVDDDD